MSKKIKTHWQALERHAEDNDNTIQSLFAHDSHRFEEFSCTSAGILLDYSKTNLTLETKQHLIELAKVCGVEKHRDQMFKGAKINTTENRAVLHTALRAPIGAEIEMDGDDVVPHVHSVLKLMEVFATSVRNGTITGATGKKFTDIVNIGIGGSDLGPAMAHAALAPYCDGPHLHFVSNVDGADLSDCLKKLSAETTLFIIASKTFTTVETMTNARSARMWLSAELDEAAVSHHFAALSTNLDQTKHFGIPDERVFEFWDWVGGRYSLWGAIGLSLMIGIGAEHFTEMLSGAHKMDRHFRTAPIDQNLPMLMGLIGVWHRSFMNFETRAILPYDQRLNLLPSYLQQLDMESNGKSTYTDGSAVDGSTGPIVWGAAGTNGQHAFYQLLHQGTTIVPCEFLVAASANENDMTMGLHHDLLKANCLAQSQALAFGKDRAVVEAELKKAGQTVQEIEQLAAHKTFTGNRPSITLLYQQLTPKTLGSLIALYEHRVFVEGVIWGINSFDQWGVELGKELAKKLLPIVQGDEDCTNLDSSTRGLVKHLKKLQQD